MVSRAPVLRTRSIRMKPHKRHPEPARPAPARLLVCDDQALVRASVRAMLRGIPSIQIVGEAISGRTAIAAAFDLEPDLILMDVSMPDLDGIAATTQILARLPNARILAFSADAGAETMRRMFAAGARGYLQKMTNTLELVTALRRVLAGEFYLSVQAGNFPNWPRRD